MTRDSDVFVPLPERVRIANRQRNAIFVCVHFNSAGRAAANGIETYYFSRESAPLAASIHRCVVSGSGTENRGVRQRGYFVLRRTAIPAVLVECGFLTNPHEAMLAETAGYRQRLADEIASGIRGQPALAARRAGSASSVAMAAAYSSSSYRVDSNGTRVLASADAAASVHSRVRHSRHSAARAHSSAKKKSSARAKTGRKSSSSHLHRKTTQKKKESNE
jgi:hypothetical protein